MFELGTLFSPSNPLVHLISVFEDKSTETYPDMNVSLGVFRRPGKGVYLYSSGPFESFLSARSAFPLHATALGKTLLAFSDKTENCNRRIFYFSKSC